MLDADADERQEHEWLRRQQASQLEQDDRNNEASLGMRNSPPNSISQF